MTVVSLGWRRLSCARKHIGKSYIAGMGHLSYHTRKPGGEYYTISITKRHRETPKEGDETWQDRSFSEFNVDPSAFEPRYVQLLTQTWRDSSSCSSPITSACKNSYLWRKIQLEKSTVSSRLLNPWSVMTLVSSSLAKRVIQSW